MADKGELVRRSDVEGGRFREMHDLLVRVEANEAETSNNMVHENHRKEDLRLLNSGLCSQNYDMRKELEALQAHCNMLRGQNVTLNGELERFVETDESIRKELNR